MFVRNDDVNLAYAAAVTVVDTDQPSDSFIVAKVSEGLTGHNCWNGNKDVCATIMTGWIEKWVRQCWRRRARDCFDATACAS